MPAKQSSKLTEEEIMDRWENYGERDINPLYGINNESMILLDICL